MDPFQLLKSKGKIKVYIAGRIGIVSHFIVVMITVFFPISTQRKMPVQTHFFPVFIPFHFISRAYKKLHFHLLKFTHPENELSCNYLISESFTNLCNAKGDFHTATLLYVQEIYKNSLGGFGTKIDLGRPVVHTAQLGAEHKVELTN